MFFPKKYKGIAGRQGKSSWLRFEFQVQVVAEPCNQKISINDCGKHVIATRSSVIRSHCTQVLFKNLIIYISDPERQKVPNTKVSQNNHVESSALLQPNHFMPLLVEAIQDEFVFYTHDMNGTIRYLSKSAERVLNIDPTNWLNRSFWDLVTDNPCNAHIRACTSSDVATHSMTGRICEIVNLEGKQKRQKMKYWRVQVVQNDVAIGFSGILRCLDTNGIDLEMTGESERDLMNRVASLTQVENQVIEMVVDGNMNKEAAALLQVAVRTIESRRSRGMAKLGANSLSELVQTWMNVRRLRASGRFENPGLAAVQTISNSNLPLALPKARQAIGTV